MNDAERLSQDPALGLSGSKNIWKRGTALTFRLRSFETEALAQDGNSTGLEVINRDLTSGMESMDLLLKRKFIELKNLTFLLLVLAALTITVACGVTSGSNQQSRPPLSLSITTPSLPNAQFGVQYQAGLAASGGTPPYSWSVASGVLPSGLSLLSSSGIIAGAPAQAGNFSFSVQVADASKPSAQTASASLSLNVQNASSGSSGPNAAGGALGLPPPQMLGNQLLGDSSFEGGGTGWTLPQCWSIDSTVDHTGTKSLRFDAGSGCALAALAPQVTHQFPIAYTLSGWVRTSAGSDLQIRIGLYDDTDGNFLVVETATVSPGPTWQFLQVNDIDLLPVHNGDKLRVRPTIVSGTTGTAWFDDIQLVQQLPPPLSAFLLYPNFHGFLWDSGPQQIRVEADVYVPDLTQVTLQATLSPVGGSPVQTVDQSATQASQQLTFDGSSLAHGSYLVQVNLLNKSNGQVIESYPPYQVTKVDDIFKNSLQAYIDGDNFLVYKGKKQFVWGLYDRFSTARCTGCLYTNASAYETNIAGFNGVGTLQNYSDTMATSVTVISPHSGIEAGPPAPLDELTPWLQAMDNRGFGYLQFVNNWVTGNPNRPGWATSLTDPQLWQLAANVMVGKPGGLGYYTYDEPDNSQMPTVFVQYQVLRAGNPGSISFGTLINARSIYRWRDVADVASCDPYPVGLPAGLDDFPYGATQTSPMVRTSVWTRETLRQVNGSRPVWMVLQLWRQFGFFPTYDQMKTQAYNAIINGANGILWWGFVSAQGVEHEWYVLNNQQAYFDYLRLSQEVAPLQPYLIPPPSPQFLNSVSDSRVQTLVKADSNQVVIFTSNNAEVPVSNVTFTLSSLVPSTVTTATVYSENRTLPISSGSFTDSFNHYEAHVYTISLH